MTVQDLLNWMSTHKGHRWDALHSSIKAYAKEMTLSLKEESKVDTGYRYKDNFNKDLEAYNAGLTSPFGHRGDLFE